MQYSELVELYEKLEKTPSRLEKTEILSEFLKKLKKEENKHIIYLLQGKIFPDYDERESGISEQLTIKALSTATAISSEEIVKEWKKQGDLGLVAEIFVKKKKQSTLSSKKLTAEKVLENLTKLPQLTGKGTVEKKISLISELLTSSSPLEAKYIIRTLLQDLRIGVGEGVLRDAIIESCFDKQDKQAHEAVQEAYDNCSDFALVFEKACKNKLKEISIDVEKPIKVMLYKKVADFEEAFETVGKPFALEFKYDGFRMVIHKSGKDIKIFTRRLDNVTTQFPEVVEIIKSNVKGENFILDSEAIGYNPKTKKYTPFQSISQRIKRKYHIEKLVKQLPIEINVFDILYYNGKSLLKEPFKARRALIEKIIKPEKYKLKLAEQIITDSVDKAEKFYKQALSEKQEGVMAKNLEAPYKPGSRVGYGVKIKPEDKDFDLVIVKAEYGTGKRAGGLTSYTVACKSGSQFLEMGKVSTGLKEKQEQGLSFTEVSNKLKKLIISEKGREVSVKPKLVVTVTYQNIQISPTYSSGFALRFPRFTRLRPDRNINDIASLAEIEKEFKKAQFNPYK